MPTTAGVLVQYPLYAAMAAVLTRATGRGGASVSEHLADLFTDLGGGGGFAVVIALYTAFLGILVPSGGGKWLVEAPYVMQSATDVNMNLGWTVQIYNAAEALPNLVNPFFMLPLLAVLGLRARDLIGFTFLQFMFHLPVVLLLLWLLGLTFDYEEPVMPDRARRQRPLGQMSGSRFGVARELLVATAYGVAEAPRSGRATAADSSAWPSGYAAAGEVADRLGDDADRRRAAPARSRGRRERRDPGTTTVPGPTRLSARSSESGHSIGKQSSPYARHAGLLDEVAGQQDVRVLDAYDEVAAVWPRPGCTSSTARSPRSIAVTEEKVWSAGDDRGLRDLLGAVVAARDRATP